MTPGLRRLYMPRLAKVEVDSQGTPVSVDGAAVEAVREEWVLEDRWWTPRPLRRHYYELVLADGRDVTVFRSGFSGRWYRQRA
jgi:hypothetical protein